MVFLNVGVFDLECQRSIDPNARIGCHKKSEREETLRRPAEKFSIAFSRITMTYWRITDQGTQGEMVTAYYDLIAGRGG